jgi:peptidyl-dipeptidase Dcp
MAPKLSAHSDTILLNAKLFARVKTLYDARDTLDLDAESRRLVGEYYTDFVRAGAQLAEPDKQRLQAINGEVATLATTFSQNVLSEVNESAVVVDTREELAGLTDSEVMAAAEAATARGLDGGYVIALLNTTGQPVLSALEDRALRERIFKASLARGTQGGEFSNRQVVTRLARLRAERAALLGYPNHAAYILEEQTAQTVEAVNERLASLAPAAVANAEREAADLQSMIDAEGGGFALAAWDWAYYTEKVRADRYAFDASQLRPYFEIDNVLQNGVFFAASRLYGVTFEERDDLPIYHPDVRVFDVLDTDGEPLGLFLGDFYARPSKRGGAWMNAYVSQSLLLGTQAVVANHLNIPKPPSGEPTLLTFDEVETMFHEFGHALHGLFSDVRYPYLAGTSVPRDFVEYPSQVNEMWATWPEVLNNYAVHHQTGEPMPRELLDKVLASATFNQGFATTEYLAASLLDQAWHQLTSDEVSDADGLLAFETAALERAGVGLDVVPPRYRSTYFSHIFSGGYSAGYYSYIWSEVLDADSVEWFKENGGLTRENGDHFRRTLLSKGGSREAMELFRDFRGAEPNIEPLLIRRGLS